MSSYRRAIARPLVVLVMAMGPLTRGEFALAQADSLTLTTAQRAASEYPHPGDRISFRLLGDITVLPVEPTLDERGRVVLPKIGVVRVDSIPISRIRDSLTVLMAKYVKDPEIDATVERRVVVSGAVARPGVAYVDIDTRLRDLIVLAGGITEIGNPKEVSITRAGRTFQVPNWQFDLSAASDLKSGDLIVVGRRSWLELNIISVASFALAIVTLIISLRHP